VVEFMSRISWWWTWRKKWCLWLHFL